MKRTRNLLFVGCGISASILIVLLLFTILATTLNPKTSVSSSGDSTGTQTQQHFRVGQQVTIGSDWQVTVNSAKTSHGNTYSTPSADNVFLIVDVTLRNTATTQQDISSAANFSLQDATGQQYMETFVSNETPPDGKVTAGSLLRGQLSYEVPQTQTQFTFHFQPDIITGGETTWDLHV